MTPIPNRPWLARALLATLLSAAAWSAQAQDVPTPAAPSPVEATPATGSPANQVLPANSAASNPDQRTQAEQDYDALYGNASQDYNPVADPTLPPPVELPASYDPWEPLNRRVHKFNNAIDHRIATPLAKTYVKVVPRPVRLGVGNFFSNLGQPVSAVNSLLQGKPKAAAQALGRFALNLTLGLGGVLDPATAAHLPNHSEDFGQTLGVWGWKRSRYVELPLFGPRTVRDVVGLIGDSPLAPLGQVHDVPARAFLQGLQLVDVRTQLFAIDSMREGATDEYALFRDAWLQRRRYQIFGDRQQKTDASLPAYLQDDSTMPADIMPTRIH